MTSTPASDVHGNAESRVVLPERPTWVTGIAVPRCAARDRRCDSCGETIPKGAPYVRHALPPNGELGNPRWWVIAACGWTTGDCRRYWEIDSKDLAGEPHAIPVG